MSGVTFIDAQHGSRNVPTDARDKELIGLVYDENGISTDDERVTPFADDRGAEDDTINRCMKVGAIKQVGDHDADTFALVPWWWPHRNAEQGEAARRARRAA